MSPQADYVVSNGTGAAVRSDINGQLAAIVSNNSGATEPATMYAYQWWADTTAGLLKLRNSANNAWITLRELDGTLLMEDGTAAAPGLSFASDLDTGFFSAGANAIGIATNGVERVEFGTTEVVFNDGGEDIDFRVEGDTEANLLFVDAGSDEVSFRDDVKIDSSGRLLIGTTASSGIDALLQVVQNSGENAQFHRGVNSTSAPQLVLSKSRNATYGSYTIVQEDDVLGIISFRGDDGTDYLSPGAQIRGEVDGTPGADDMPGRIVLATTADGDSSPTERMRIDSSGRLLIGTSSASSTATTLLLQGSPDGSTGPSYLRLATGTASPGSTSTIGQISFTDSGHSTAASIVALRDGGTWTSGSSQPTKLTFSTTADGASTPTERMRLDSAGDFLCVGIYNNTTASAANVRVAATGRLDRSTSSAKYKTSIETLEDSYADAILACRPVWYRSTCKNDNPDYGWWGFIAEEVAAIDPRLVHWKTVEVTYDENGSAVQTPCDPEPEGVAYDRFVPHLLNLIKRQKEQIETQGTAIAALEARLTALESQ
jgi:hypothetical protein